LGGTLAIGWDGSTLTIDDANVTQADIVATDGILHEIDRVLLPSMLDVVTTDDDFYALAEAIERADAGENPFQLAALLDGPGPLTLFAPRYDAFETLVIAAATGSGDLDGLVEGLGGASALFDLLSYHLLDGELDTTTARDVAGGAGNVEARSGDPLYVDIVADQLVLNERRLGAFAGQNSARLLARDLITSTGVLHGIDSVLLPNVSLMEAMPTVPSVTSMATALDAAGLSFAVTDVTVLAPTNTALAALLVAAGVREVEDLSVAQLQHVLPHHLVPGLLSTEDAIAAAQGPGSVRTLIGAVDLAWNGTTLTVDGAGLVQQDLLCSDGILHIVDAVLLPSMLETVTYRPELSTLQTAIET
ncbi:MAG: fasciclin domain-containing protein, partial [Phycisphaerales bacterium]|nr:fasciclin domain-containing protein [Phycisphaerales bacterium]